MKPNERKRKRQCSLEAEHSLVEKLPPEILIKMLRYLAYEDLIYLSTLSRSLLKKVDPSIASRCDKCIFVLKAESEFNQHQPNEQKPLGNFGCYCCYNVQIPGSFGEIEKATFFPEGITAHPQRMCERCKADQQAAGITPILEGRSSITDSQRVGIEYSCEVCLAVLSSLKCTWTLKKGLANNKKRLLQNYTPDHWRTEESRKTPQPGRD